MVDEEGEVEASIAPDLPEIASFISFRYLKGANVGVDELGCPSSLRKEHRVSLLVSPWPAEVIFAVGHVHTSAWVVLEALGLPGLLANPSSFLET